MIPMMLLRPLGEDERERHLLEQWERDGGSSIPSPSPAHHDPWGTRQAGKVPGVLAASPGPSGHQPPYQNPSQAFAAVPSTQLYPHAPSIQVQSGVLEQQEKQLLFCLENGH